MPGIVKTKKTKDFEAAVIARVALAMSARQLGVPELKDRLEALIGWQAGSSVYQWFKQRLLPSGAVAAALPRALGVNAEWLFWGEGSMDQESPTPAAQWVRGVQYATARIAETTAALQGEASRHDRELAAGFPSGLGAEEPGQVPLARPRVKPRAG